MKTSYVKVIEHREMAERIFELQLQGDIVEHMGEPGQFVHISSAGRQQTLLRRPISIAAINHEQQIFTIIYRVDGAGTENLSEKKPGDLLHILGPLGHGFPIEHLQKGQKAMIVGGGIGIPPLYELTKQLQQKDVDAEIILGFSSKKAVFYEKAFSKFGRTDVTTVDGSYAYKGFVTDVMADRHFDVLYACGPTPMLKALEDQYGDCQAYFSLEERMGCALGVCMACVCHVQGDETGVAYRKVCRDGPVFPAGEVVL